MYPFNETNLVHLENQRYTKAWTQEKIAILRAKKGRPKLRKRTHRIGWNMRSWMKWHASEHKELQGRLFTPLLAHARPVCYLVDTVNKFHCSVSWHLRMVLSFNKCPTIIYQPPRNILLTRIITLTIIFRTYTIDVDWCI